MYNELKKTSELIFYFQTQNFYNFQLSFLGFSNLSLSLFFLSSTPTSLSFYLAWFLHILFNFDQFLQLARDEQLISLLSPIYTI